MWQMLQCCNHQLLRRSTHNTHTCVRHMLLGYAEECSWPAVLQHRRVQSTTPATHLGFLGSRGCNKHGSNPRAFTRPTTHAAHPSLPSHTHTHTHTHTHAHAAHERLVSRPPHGACVYVGLCVHRVTFKCDIK